MFSFALALSFAHAEDAPAPSKFPIVKPSGVFYAHYLYTLTDGADGYNEFGVDRVYVRTDVQINKRFSSRVTLDADRVKPLVLADGSSNILDTKYRVFVKHAYLSVKELGPLEIRAGMIDTPYAPYYDNLFGNRYLTESFAKNAGVLDTACVDWNVSLLNGEGYGKLEVDAGKSVQARVSVDPLAQMEDRDLPITAFAAMSGHPSTTGEPTLVFGGSAGFQMPRLFVWAEVLTKMEGSVTGFGYSATLNPRLPKYAGLVFRYDHWDPDGATDDDATTTLMGALEKDFTEKIAVALTYDRSWHDASPDTAAHAVGVRMQAGF